MEINLLPQKPSLFQPAWILWGTACFIAILSSISISMNYHNLKVQENFLQQQQASLMKQQKLLQTQNTKIDPHSEQLIQYKAELNRLDKQRVDWQARLNSLANQLPTTGVILNLSYQKNEITMSGKLDSVKTVVQYVELLQKVPWIQSVTLTSITDNTKSSESGSTTGVSSGVSDISGSVLVDANEKYDFNLKIQTKEPASDSKQNSGGNKQ